jgi:protein-S-isoprenylcysteine O-methyltransferase
VSAPDRRHKVGLEENFAGQSNVGEAPTAGVSISRSDACGLAVNLFSFSTNMICVARQRYYFKSFPIRKVRLTSPWLFADIGELVDSACSQASPMNPLAKNIISTCWGVFIVVWLLAAIFTKRTVYRESGAQHLRYMLPIAIGCWLLFRGYRLPYPFNVRIIPQTDAILVVSSILCICGVAFCFWARAVLGRNWSGAVTLKENHELIVRGPYRIVRHPIYTGLLAMVLATEIQQGHIAGSIGLILIFVSLWIKSSHEEELMRKQFPEQYPVYRERVKRIIPFIL